MGGRDRATVERYTRHPARVPQRIANRSDCSLRESDQRTLFDVRRLNDCLKVPNACVEREIGHIPVAQAGPALIEADYPIPGFKRTEEPLPAGVIPVAF